MKPKQILVPAVTTQEALLTCVAASATIFAIERPLYSEVLPHLDMPNFLPGYSLELYSDKKIIVAKRNRFPHRFTQKRIHPIYQPLGWL